MSFIVNRALSGAFLSLPYVKPAVTIGITASVMSVALRTFHQPSEVVEMAAMSGVVLGATGAIIDMILYIGYRHRNEAGDPGGKLF